jgi:hypothetical protein
MQARFGPLQSTRRSRRARIGRRFLQNAETVQKCKAPSDRCRGVDNTEKAPKITDTCISPDKCYIDNAKNGCGERFAGSPLAKPCKTIEFSLSSKLENVRSGLWVVRPRLLSNRYRSNQGLRKMRPRKESCDVRSTLVAALIPCAFREAHASQGSPHHPLCGAV